jgi:protein TonB
MFELIAKDHRRVPHGDSLPMLLSFALHSAMVTLVFLASILFISSPVPQFEGIMAFVAPVLPPPPPPPPVPSEQASTGRLQAQLASADAAPVEMPRRIEPEPVIAENAIVLDTPGVVAGSAIDSPPTPPPSAPPLPPPPPPVPAAPVRVGGVIGQPTLLTRVGPAYPPMAVQAHVEGVVVLEAVVDRQGRVENVRILRSIPLLDQAAIDAVKQWQYAPLLVNGQPASFIITVTVSFALARERTPS